MQQRRKRARTSVPPRRLSETYADDERYETDDMHASPTEPGRIRNSSCTSDQPTTVEINPVINLTDSCEPLPLETGNIPDHRAMSPYEIHSPESHTLKVHDLSFILHPSHEPHQNSRRDNDGDDFYILDASPMATTDQSMLNRACTLLGISLESMNYL